MNYLKRQQNLRETFADQGIDSMLITHPVNVRYLTGFTGDSTHLLVSEDKVELLSDGRFTVQLQEECPEIPAIIRDVKTTLPQATANWLGSTANQTIGFESDRVVHSLWSALAEEATLKPVCGLVETLRTIKDAEELLEIQAAVEMAERAFTVFRHQLSPDWTERQAASILEELLRQEGAVGFAFDVIIGAGANAALPHAPLRDVELGSAELVLIDWGARTPSGYCSDLTRTLLTPNAPEPMREIYQLVLDAHDKAIEAIAPGVPCIEVDQIARIYLTEAGYGKEFNHGLGHGFGLEVHEATRFSPSSSDVLQPGMVVTIEPGIYLQDVGGVRIEDDILVTETGCRSLSTLKTSLNDAMIPAWGQ